jgi:hypothetical protein
MANILLSWVFILLSNILSVKTNYLGDARFYNVGAELYEEKSKPDRFNIINDLNIFPIAGNACNRFIYFFIKLTK